MSAAGVQAILDVSLSYINEARDSAKHSLLVGITDSGDFPTKSLTDEELKIITEALIQLLNKKISLIQACQIINPIVGTQHPMQKVAGILSISDDPLPPKPQDYSENLSRHKTRPWIPYEDQRLLAAILRYGFDNWVLIAEFVGNGRTRSQCSQRWNRGLNPKISKGTWSKEEEEKLLNLVSKNGDKSWTKISMEFGNRSDVQCRYRYQQLQKDNQITEKNSFKDEENNNEENLLGAITQPTAQHVDDEIQQQKNENIIKIDYIKTKEEAKIQIPSLIPLHDQIKNQINIQTELPKQFPPASFQNNPSFLQQNKNQQQQDNSALPKITLPKIDPSIFMEC